MGSVTMEIWGDMGSVCCTISARSRLDLGSISARSRPDLGCIGHAAPALLGAIAASERRGGQHSEAAA